MRSHHATALALGEKGLLLMGESGAGKSSLALALIEAIRARGSFGALVGDDRVVLTPHGGRLIARAHPAIAGRIEARGSGLLAVAHLPAIPLDAVVSIEGEPARMPDEGHVTLEGVALPRLALRRDADLAAKAAQVLLWMEAHGTRSESF